MRINIYYFLLAAVVLAGGSCRKLISISDPINTITSKAVFNTNEKANSAMAGIYTKMINGLNPSNNSAYSYFSDGLTTLLTGLSSDEFIFRNSAYSYTLFNTNKLLYNSVGSELWTTAYDAIYGANGVLEGIAASTSPALTDSVRKRLTGEAKFIRAFCYFYLTNLYGDVPLALTVDFNKTIRMARTAQTKVYEQVVADLKDAQGLLAADFSAGGGERVLPNKWAATALLARVYLYLGQYGDAAIEASAVIGASSMFGLPADLNSVFLVNSHEAIWQLKQSTDMPGLGTATPEASVLLPNMARGFPTLFCLSDQLMNAWEAGDGRRTAWVGEDNTVTSLPFYAHKYKTGLDNFQVGVPPAEYYMVLRLAEQYLIRAEAMAHGAAGGAAAAVADLNVIRHRAGLGDLDASLSGDALLAAVAHERQVELFAEWGHRWLDLKRTGKAHAVLSQIPMKQPWAGDYQLLYPIPFTEIQNDPQLKQNEGY